MAIIPGFIYKMDTKKMVDMLILFEVIGGLKIKKVHLSVEK